MYAELNEQLRAARAQLTSARAELEAKDKRIAELEEKREWIAFKQNLTAEVERQSVLLGKAREALGFGVYREEMRDGQKINICEDAALDLSGALEDLTNSNGNDEVTRRTISRVVERLESARAVLSELQLKGK